MTELAKIFDELSGATAAVVRLEGDAPPRVIGTAWLARSPGVLITAGHLFLDDTPEASDDRKSVHIGLIRVQFPSGPLEKVKLVAGPIVDRPSGIDVAVLEVENPADSLREPLRMMLTTNAEGDVVQCGYGMNTPRAQTFAEGKFLRPYIRDNDKEKYLLQHYSHDSAFKGWSGSAVYSLKANAVISVQLEANPNYGQVLSMPLSRILEHWRELIEIVQFASQATCFVILPEGTDKSLLKQVIEPVLEKLHIDLRLSAPGITSDEDLAMLEAADIILADATVDDSYVTRELTIAQGLGTPDVVVRTGPHLEPRNTLHNTSLYLDLGDPEAAKSALQNRLIETRETHKAIDELVSKNPITSFFGAPLTNVSAANALALGYFQNFVQRVGHALIGVGKTEIRISDRLVNDQQFDVALLEVVLPTQLRSANTVSQERSRFETQLEQATVINHEWDRPRTMYVAKGWETSRRLILIDLFPTTLMALRDSVIDRLGGDEHSNEERWQVVQRKELDRFARTLARKIRQDEVTGSRRQLSDVCTVVSASQAFTA